MTVMAPVPVAGGYVRARDCDSTSNRREKCAGSAGPPIADRDHLRTPNAFVGTAFAPCWTPLPKRLKQREYLTSPQNL